MEAVAVAASGLVLSPLLTRVLNKLLDSLGINAEKVRQKLIVIVLPQLKSMIEKVEAEKEEEASEDRIMWEKLLQMLKDAYDKAEDTLDLHKYTTLAAAASSTVLRYSRCIMPVLPQRKIKLRQRLNKAKEVTDGAEKRISQKKKKKKAEKSCYRVDSSQDISLPPYKVFGRDEDCEKIIQYLKTEPAVAIDNPGSMRIPVIAIVGRPGVGKTTLAQYVCQKLRSEELPNWHFPLVMWVCASYNFNAFEIMKNILQQPSNPSQNSFNVSMIDCLEVLHNEMGQMLHNKKFLLVIDDVWYDVEDQKQKKNWDILFRCFTQYHLRGSKILVTSQMKDAPRNIVAAKGATLEYTHYLEELEENDFLDLFIHHAGMRIDSSLRIGLEEKLKTIAEKLNKDPTAAKEVGWINISKLADDSRSQDDWLAYLRMIEQNDWSSQKTIALMWSYQHLSAHLQRCFSYLSLYPRGYEFKDLELVQLWMAQDFIKPEYQNERMEDVGNGYLNKLVSRFYIQRHNRVHSSFGTVYMLHELFWNLAEKVSNDCYRIKDNHKSEIPPTIRHLSIPAYKLDEYKKEICKLKRLRTLIITRRGSGTSEESVATDVFKNWKNLRVLISEVNLENLAEFISEMKHLRILQVPGTSEFVLPESVCTLYMLQVLIIKSARSLPKHFNNLVNLRYLESSSGIANISNLTSLQGLENFQVRKKKGYELKQLQSLNELRGCLCITNLENVESKESAIAANLKKKEHLDTLKLVWQAGGNNVDCNLHAVVLEGLNLPPNLTSLHLDGYGGQLWPSWLISQTSDSQEPHSLQFLSLENCSNLSNPPEGTNLARSLKNISIQGCPILEQSIYVDEVSGKRMFRGIPVQTASTQSL